jgi:predicted transcriptional regulator
VAFFFLRLDHAGNISKRFSANGFRFARFGGACPRWNIHEAFQAPRKTVVQIVEAEDGAAYLAFSRTVSGLGRGFQSPAQSLAIGMGCRLEDARKLVYADGLDLAAARATPIGINCRICERVDCNQRAYPPLNRSAAISEHRRGLSPFTFETW